MTRNFKNGLLVAAVLATASPLLLTSVAFAKDPPTKEEREAAREKAKAARTEAQQTREQAQQARAPARDANQDAAQARERARANAAQAAQHRQQAELAAQQAAQRANQAERQENRAERQQAQVANQAARQENRADRQQAQVANQAARQDARAARRLSEAQQKALITTQQTRVNSYRSWSRAQRTEAARIAAAVRAQNRAQQYTYLQDYQNRLWAQQQQYASQSLNYYNDPFFYTAPSYRYMRGGSWYTINSYGADLLQQAINEGYGEGYRSGRADRMDGWRFDYRSSWVYQNASYGYSGFYLDRGEYAYYFREGFRRGYEDGYYSRYRYGSYRNGDYSILGAVLNTVLSLQSYDHRY